MEYLFLDLGPMSCGDVARQIRPLLVGHLAVNSSWDSGRYSRPDWSCVNGFAVTPPINDQLIDAWPVSHDGIFDEWWVFETVVPVGFEVHAFCNYVNMRIAEYRELDWDQGCPLEKYLNNLQPLAVFGNNELAAYLIRRKPPTE